MVFPERFSDLPEYAFPRLRALLDEHPAGGDVVQMTIGEPRHAFPDMITDIIIENAGDFGKYPPNDGTPELRRSVTDWVARRYGASLDPDAHVMVLNGTREGLFNAVLAVSPERKGGKSPLILTPNPFYQVYAVGALAAGAEPTFVPATVATGHLPDYGSLPPEVLDRVTVAFLCSPANPQGAAANREYWAELLALAEKYDFQVFADECYSEIYRHDPPPGILEVAAEIGADPERAVSFHSLSKRSNLPGLRSGFVAAGPQTMKRIKQLRAYAGAPLPLPLQRAAERVWADETHVKVSRARYQEKYLIADRVLGDAPGYVGPEAGFFLWLPVDDGESAALKLWRETGVRALPGAYLARDVDGKNPGKGYIRAAMVVSEQELEDGLQRLRACLYS